MTDGSVSSVITTSQLAADGDLPAPWLGGEYPGAVSPSAEKARREPAVVVRGGYGSVGYGGVGRALGTVAHTYAILDEQERQSVFGVRLRKYMMRDAACRAAVEYLVTSVVGGELRILPAVRAKPGRASGSRPTNPADIEAAGLAAEFCQWLLDNLEVPIRDTLREMVRGALIDRAKLAELEWVDRAFEGESRSLPRALGLERIAGKPRGAWRFVTDQYGRLLGYEVQTDEGAVVLDRRDFWVQVYDARDGDPSGNSILEAAMEPWNLRVQGWPQWFLFLQRFGSPSLVGYTAPNAAAEVIQDGTGTVTATVSPTQSLRTLLEQFRAFTVLALPNGSDAKFLEPQGEGQVFDKYADCFKREIFLAILLSVRVLAESQYGSRADSQTSQDVSGNVIMYLKHWAADGLVWAAFYEALVINFGRSFADQYTPEVSLGAFEHQDLGNLLRAFSMVGFKLVPSMVPALCSLLGLPVPEPEEVERYYAADAGPAGAAPPNDDPAPNRNPPVERER